MPNKPFRIVLLPLDDRPVNTYYPQMLAEIGGVELSLPPVALRGLQRLAADPEAVSHWLEEQSRTADVCIVSCDSLGYGNLIHARISDDTTSTVLDRLALLPEINARIPVHAFSLITRVANANNAAEEPLYWAELGTRFYQYSQLRHRVQCGVLSEADQVTLTELETVLPSEAKRDWLTRRLRNHAVNLVLLEMAARGQIESLLITSDDTAAYGLPTRERDWLQGWRDLMGDALGERVQMHPGADEVSSALVAALINRVHEWSPRVWIDYSIAEDSEVIASYEDRPVRETVLGQIEACGCVVASSPQEADFVLGVVTPSPRRADFSPEFLPEDRITRTPHYRRFLARLANYADHLPVAIADVAYCNGADGLFSEVLLAVDCPLAPGRLVGYGAWNTAGNTIGVVIAEAALATGNPETTDAQNRFLAHHFLEDYGYQLIVRREAVSKALSLWGRMEPDPSSDLEQQELCAFIERRLTAVLVDLQNRGIGEGLHLVPGSVSLPWRRTFEIDFRLTEIVTTEPHQHSRAPALSHAYAV